MYGIYTFCNPSIKKDLKSIFFQTHFLWKFPLKMYCRVIEFTYWVSLIGLKD